MSEDQLLVDGPLVSVVVLTYNQEPFIAQTIDSILAQETGYKYEILIGEDFSTDGTRKIVEKYREKHPTRIRVIADTRNVGLLDNWTRTVRAARGKYVSTCGGDDYWHHPKKLQRQVKFLEAHPDVGLVHSDYDFLYQHSGEVVPNIHRLKGYRHEDDGTSTLQKLIGQKYPIRASTVTFRKEMFDKYFDVEMLKRNNFMMEDTPLYIEIAAHARMHYMDESLATYRLMEESISQSKDAARRLRFWVSDSEMYLYYCDKYNLPRSITEIHEKSWRQRALKLAFVEGKGDMAELVRQKSSAFSAKDWLWYVGSRNGLMRQLVLLLRALTQRGK